MHVNYATCPGKTLSNTSRASVDRMAANIGDSLKRP